MDTIETIASKLLQSSDARIAEAAKRVFTSSSSALVPKSRISPPSYAIASPTLSSMSSSLSSISGMGVVAAAALSSFAAGNAVPPPSTPSTPPVQNVGGVATTQYDPRFSSSSVHPGADSIGSNDGDVDELDENGKKLSTTDRLQRSRERNRMHARKTRQRKKEHMQMLQDQVDDLKHEQIRIKQAINEKNTANILIGLFQNGASDSSTVPTADPEVEELMKRSPEDIPDASAIPELPALILPGNGKRKLLDTTGADSADGRERVVAPDETLEDGIDYILLGKDRSACTSAELDQIRRERNRMHAKRTRDRKRIFMEEMEVMIKKLEDENLLLMSHAKKLNAHVPLVDADKDRGGDRRVSSSQSDSSDPLFTGESNSTSNSNTESNSDVCRNNNDNGHERGRGDFLNQIESLLAAAESFQRSGNVETKTCEMNAITCAESDVTASTHSCCDEEMYDNGYEMLAHLKKRQNTSSMDHGVPSCSVPKSITTTNYSFDES